MKIEFEISKKLLNIFIVSKYFTREIGGKTKKIESESDIFIQILSEIIELQENGGGGGNQTQIPNFQFYIGIAQ